MIGEERRRRNISIFQDAYPKHIGIFTGEKPEGFDFVAHTLIEPWGSFGADAKTPPRNEVVF